MVLKKEMCAEGEGGFTIVLDFYFIRNYTPTKEVLGESDGG